VVGEVIKLISWLDLQAKNSQIKVLNIKLNCV